MSDRPKHRCCDTFELAKEPGTDNEGYGRLVFWAGAVMVGAGLPPINFCPWCGARIKDDWKEEEKR